MAIEHLPELADQRDVLFGTCDHEFLGGVVHLNCYGGPPGTFYQEIAQHLGLAFEIGRDPGQALASHPTLLLGAGW